MTLYQRLKKHYRNARKGFTFIEVMITAFLLGLFVITLQGNLSNLFQLQNLAKLESDVYKKTFNIFQYIQSGRGISTYTLTKAEIKGLERKGADFNSIKGFIEHLGRHRFRKGERNIVFRRQVKFDNEPHQVKVERTVIEPAPFMFGLVIQLSDSRGKKAELRGIISYYDLLGT